ncbi:MAG: hypothetical protein MK538_05945 [Planctomycetes bacterium]|nr:hypothetical protein [Planctomycetota bacterium]
MEWISEHWYQTLVVVVYLGILAHHAWSGSRRTHNLSDYLVAGRGLGGLAIAFSYYATFVSTNSFVGHAGKSWDVGLIWYLKGVAFVIFCYASWYLVAPRFVSLIRQYGSLTVADFLGSRYRSTALRRLSAAVIFVTSTFYLVAVYKGSSLALSQFFGISYQAAAVIVFVVVTAYTLAGGFRSVVLTDTLQGVFMVCGAIGLIVALLVKGDGLVHVIGEVRRQDPELVSWGGKMPFMTVLGLSIAGGLKFLVEPRQLSRYYGLKDQSALRVARLVSPILLTVTFIAVLPIGTLAHAVIPPEAITDSDEVIPYLLGHTELLGPYVSPLFLMVLVSAAMSSLDSVLLVAASSVEHDLLTGWGDSARAILRTRICVFVLSFVSLLLALFPFAGIVEITAFTGSIYGACFLPPIVVGLYWKHATSRAAIACVALGAFSVGGWFAARRAGFTDWHEVYAGLVVGFVTYVGVTLFDRRGGDEQLSGGEHSG